MSAFATHSASSVKSSAHAIRSRWGSMSNRSAFDFPALTYWPKRSSARMAYLSIFPVGAAMRANLMVYRDMTDPWLPGFRQAPEDAMRALMPGMLDMIGEFKVIGTDKDRPAD